MSYLAASGRYNGMKYRRCGASGLRLPAISLGLWHNFGGVDRYETGLEMIKRAFDLGITHFDLANNYGPPPGSAEETFGKMINGTFKAYRDELVISTKAGYEMWDGPYGNWGSRKHVIASLEQSLGRLRLDYVDIFYHHRLDLDTPLEETMDALAHVVRQGKALYVGLSNYDAEQARRAAELLRQSGTRCLIVQPRYSMLAREAETGGLLDTLLEKQIGSIAFSPLEKGILTDRYLGGIPSDSRAAGNSVFLRSEEIDEPVLDKVRKLNEMAQKRGQKMSQMALAWVLRKEKVTSALIGASKVGQIEDAVAALDRLSFTEDELKRIDAILNG